MAYNFDDKYYINIFARLVEDNCVTHFSCSSTAVLFEDAVILGAACDVVSYTMSSSAQHHTDMPFCTLERTVS